MTEQQPRFSEGAEQNLLGALILEPSSYDRIAGKISSGDFYFESHSILFAMIEQMLVANRPLDIFTVSENLQNAGQLDAVGGDTYLNHLVANTIGHANITAYAKNIVTKATERRLLSATFDISEIVHSGMEIEEKLAAAQQVILAIGDSQALSHEPVEARQLASEVVAEIQKRYENGGAIPGISTGYSGLDNQFGGLMPGNLIIIAGRPGAGKTTLALNIAENVSADGGVVLFLSLEMSRMELGMRSMASLGRVDLKNIKGGKFEDEDDWVRLTLSTGRLAESGLIVDEYSNTVARIAANARRIKRQKGKISCLVVDYIGLMTAKAENKTNEIAEITRGLKLLAKELGCAIIALAQLNRKVEDRADKRPQLSDLRDSGAIEQDADIVMFAYRDEYYYPDSPSKGIAELIVAKNRMGETGIVPMSYFGRYSRFDNFSGEFVRVDHKQKPRKSMFDD